MRGDDNGISAFEIIQKQKIFEEIYNYKGNVKGSFYKKTVYENFISAEVYVVEKSSQFKLKRPFIELLDHDKFLNSILEKGEAPKHEDFPALSSGGDEMGWALFDLFKWWSRGNKDLAITHFLKIADELRSKK